MSQFTNSCLAIIILLLNILDSIQQNVDTTSEGSKIFVDPSNNVINAQRPSQAIKPTAAQVEFEPGVPPGWSKPPAPSQQPQRPTRPSRPPRPTIRPQKTSRYTPSYLEEVTLSPVHNDKNLSKPAVLEEETTNKYPAGVSAPEPIIAEPERGVVDWILGLVGFKPTESPSPSPSKPSRSCGKCSCGLTYQHTRIVGGIETQVNEYPWMVYLLNSNRFYCGAFLINNKYLLTAGHCVSGVLPSRLAAVFLDHDRSTPHETKNFTMKISRIIRHSGYGIGGSYNNDLALLRLANDMPFSGIIKPVCLPDTRNTFAGQNGIVTGWGTTQPLGQVSNRLREVHVPIWSNEDCVAQSGYGNRITENMLCAGLKQGSKDSCQGDSGGPLHVVTVGRYIAVGIVSWGEGCAQPNFPGVYTRIDRYMAWIYGNTPDACYC